MACCPYMKWKTKKVLKKMSENRVKRTVLCRKRKSHFISWFVFKQALAVECWCGKRKLFYPQLNNLRFPFPIWRRKKKFKKCDTNNAFLSWYGVKKIVHSIVGSNSIFWVVRVWKGKYSFFIINLAKWHFLSLYGAWKEVKIFPFKLSKWTFAVQIVVKKGKSFEF